MRCRVTEVKGTNKSDLLLRTKDGKSMFISQRIFWNGVDVAAVHSANYALEAHM